MSASQFMPILARLAAGLPRRDATPMIERGIGYWILPDGRCVPTPPRVSHADVARALIDADTLGEAQRESYEADLNSYAIGEGWTRMRIYPDQRVVFADFGSGRQQAHRCLLEELLDNLGLVGYRITDTDEHGNYVSP